MIYGKPSLNIDDDITDKIGIRTLVLSQFWQPSRWPMSLVELDAEAPPSPPVSAGLLLIGHQTRRSGGALRTTWTFEGVNGDGKSVTFRTRANTIDFGFEPGFAQVDMKLHPDYEDLRKQYNGWAGPDGEIIWPATIDSSSGAPGLGPGAAESVKNPMFGVNEWLRMEGTYNCRYAAFSLAGLQDGVGNIFISQELPGDPPSVEDRNWLKAPVLYRRRGTVYDINESYWLSGRGGWPTPVYPRDGQGKSGPGQRGLRTGSLRTGTLTSGSL